MPSLLELLELQERFGVSLESRDAAAAPGIDVYRHAIAANYRRALAATYPRVRELIGASAFDAAVDAFVVAHPPVSGDLNVYGDAFAAFLEQHAPARSDAHDMARLEWAIDESSRAADVDSTPGEVVAALTVLEDDAVAEATLSLHPSCRLVGGARELLLIRRDGARTVVEKLGPGEFAWLGALQSGATFEAALAQALERDADFDLERALSERVHDGTLCGIGRGRYNPRHG